MAKKSQEDSITFSRTLTPGDYYLKLTSVNPEITNYQTPYQFTITTTLNNENNDFESLSFYPNPVKNILYLENIDVTKASVYNVLGQLIFTKTFDNNNSNMLDMSNLESGLYLIVLENNAVNKTIKIVKE